MNTLSIIIPVLDEAATLAPALAALQPLRQAGSELVVVDGGSSDATAELAAPYADRLVTAPRGRARQMNAGTAIAGGTVLLFLHADTRLPDEGLAALAAAVAAGHCWGRFDVRIDGQSPLLAIVAKLMNWRSRLTGIATGDQAMFVTREAFAAVGGFPDIPLMEDIVMSRKLLGRQRPACLRQVAATSGRRWESRGVLRTIALMWWLRLRFFCGADPARLALAYGYRPTPDHGR